jgi:hypothetical protein
VARDRPDRCAARHVHRQSAGWFRIRSGRFGGCAGSQDLS